MKLSSSSTGVPAPTGRPGSPARPGQSDLAGVPAPRDHGGDGPSVAAALGLDPASVLDLSASLNPLAPSWSALLTRHLDSIRRYPDASRATAALSERLGVRPARLLLTNGGSEAIALVAGHLRAGWVHEPDFGLYARYLEQLDPGAPLWRSNPHNPTGQLAQPGETAGVWDEAFFPLASGQWTRGDADAGSIVVGSLTKLLACPGLRVGYVLADEATVAWLSRRQPEWSLNGLAASALPEMLEGVALEEWARRLASMRQDMLGVLAKHGLHASPSDANYVLVERALGLRERLARQGVVVRSCASFGLPDSVRIAVPSEAGLQRLDSALSRCAEVAEEGSGSGAMP